MSSYIGIGVSYGDLYLFHIMMFSAFVVTIFQIKEKNYKLNVKVLSRSYVYPLIIMLSWYIFSLIWTPSLEMGLKYIFYIICGIVITICVISYSKNIFYLSRLFRTMSFFVFFQIFISILESFSNFRMPTSSYSPYAIFLGKEPINFSQFDNIFLYSNIRPPTGLHWNTNDLAVSMIIVLPFFLCNKNVFIKFFGILSITSIIIMTASRAAFLALILTYTFYLFFIKKKIGTLTLILTISFGIFWTMLELRESENPRINELANSVDALRLYLSGDIDVGGSLEWRRELIENGLEAFYNTYGLGLGAGGSAANQEIIGPVAGRFTSMHNFWIELLVEGGIIIGLLIFVWISSMTQRLFLIMKNTSSSNLKYYSESLFLSLTAFIPAAIASSSTIYFFPMWIMYGFIISVIILDENLILDQ